PGFEPLFDAVSGRQPVRFGYRDNRGEDTVRHLQPWGLVSWRGRWYVGGHDTDRAAPRVFRLSRITGPVQPDGPAGAAGIPAGIDVRAMVTSRIGMPDAPVRTCRLHLAPGTAQRLRVTATATAGDPDTIEVEFRSVSGFAGHLAGYGPDVRVLEPADLRDAV